MPSIPKNLGVLIVKLKEISPDVETFEESWSFTIKDELGYVIIYVYDQIKENFVYKFDNK